MMVRLMLAAALVLLLPVAAAAEGATETGWTKVTMPANDGFVLSFEVPPGWRYGYDALRSNQYAPKAWPTHQKLYTWLYHPADPGRVSLDMMAFSGQVSLEDFVNDLSGLLKPEVNTAQADYWLQAGFDQSFGRRSGFRTMSCEAGSTDPCTRRAATMFHDRVGIDAKVDAYRPNNFSGAAKVFDRIIKSIAVTPVADLDADQIWRLYVSPWVTFTPGKWYLEGYFSLEMPPGWQIEEVEVLTAGSGDAEAGRMVVEFFPPESSEDASFTVQMDGKPYDVRLNAAEFLATRDPIVASMANEARVVESEAEVGMPSDQVQDGYCLSQNRTRRFLKTGRTEVKSYAGKDALTGQDVKLRIYTAGGVTLACNMIFRAPPDEFQRLAPQVDQMVRSLKVGSQGPIMFK